MRAKDKSGLDHLGRPCRASSEWCTELSLQELGLLREAGGFQSATLIREGQWEFRGRH